MATTTATNSAPSTSLTLAEEGGITLTLKDRALPYRPISINGRQRAEFTWYPGSPQATVQMLGPEEGVISLRGFWKDRFLAGSGNLNVTGSPVTTLSTTEPVTDLVKLVDQMRRNGRTVKLTWDALIRYGHITSFTQTWHNSHDVEWELEFSVISQEKTVAATTTPPESVSNLESIASTTTEEVTSLTQPPTVPPTEFARRLVVRRDEIPALKPAPEWWEVFAPGWKGALDLAQSGRTWADNISQNANQWAAGVAQVASQALYLVQTPGDVARSVLNAVTGPATTLSNASAYLFDGALTEYFAVAETGLLSYLGIGAVSQDNVPFGLQIAEKSYVTGVKRAVQAVRTSNAIWRSQYTAEQQSTSVRTFVADRDMDLRDVCTKFYGTPDRWQDLMLYNGLLGSRIAAGYVVRVPSRLNGSPAGRT